MKISEAMKEEKRVQADVASGITLRIEPRMIAGRLSVEICGKETSSVSNCAEAEAWFEKRGFGAANWRPHNWVAASWAARSARSAAENQEVTLPWMNATNVKATRWDDCPTRTV
jgi:hypothetical protein